MIQKRTGPALFVVLLMIVPAMFWPTSPERRMVWVAIVLLLLLLGLVFRLVLDLRNGWVSSRTGRWYSRLRDPAGYWVQMTVNILLTLACLGVALAMR